MTLYTIINSILIAILGGFLWLASFGRQRLLRRRQLLTLWTLLISGAALLFYVMMWICGPGVIAPPDSLYGKIITFIFFAALVSGVAALVSLVIVSAILIFVLVPSLIRRFLSVVVCILATITAVTVLSDVFEWGWDFPGVFGLVTGLVALGFTLYDRYLTKGEDARAEAGASRKTTAQPVAPPDKE